jgi:hypothetical protein
MCACIVAKYNYNDRVKEDEMRRAFSSHGAKEDCIEVSGWKARRKYITRRRRRRWEDNNKINLTDIEWGFIDWINLAQDID